MAEPLRKTENEKAIERRIVDRRPALEERRPVSEVPVERGPSRQAYQILRYAFTIVPFLAGLDKFFRLLGDWDNYVAPVFPRILGVAPHSFMMGVGVIEIIAGIGVAVKPKIFGYVVGFWLIGIMVNLFIRGGFYDIALRDFGLCLGAFALARLAVRFDHK